MTTLCSCCGRDITRREKKEEINVACLHCNWILPKGANSWKGRIIKRR